ncbi:hypothetical protein RUND412_003217 [Rhizina undulata]
MNSGPSEILLEILSYIPEKELRSVRLVSHFFKNVATERYFWTFRIPRTFEDATAKLLHISRRPELAGCVRYIIYAHQPLPPSSHRRTRSTELDESELAEINATRGIGWSSPLNESFGEQIASGEFLEFAKVPEFALSRMVNVREIIRIGIFLMASERIPRTLAFPDPMYGAGEENSLGAFNEIMTTASQAHTRLDKLSMHATWRGILTDYPEILWRCAPLLQNLTALSVYFSFTAPHSQNFEALHQDAQILDWRINHRDPVIPLLKLFGDDYVWENLETFLFNGEPIHGEELMHFLARHAPTLKTLGLYRPHLRTGTWRGVLDSVKEQPALCLKKLILIERSEEHEHAGVRSYVGWNDRDSQRRILDYVLHGGRLSRPKKRNYSKYRLGSKFVGEDEYQFEWLH